MTNTPLLTIEKLTLRLRNPFRLSYGVSETREAFWLRLRDDAGWGEGTIPPYYGVDQAAMTAFWESAAGRDDPLPETPLAVEPWVGSAGPAPARCALELALYDRLGRKAGLPLWKLLNLPAPEPRTTSFTIAIDTPEAMARMAAELANFPVIKVKLGGDGDDEARLAAIRAARPDARLRVDANAGWTYLAAQEYLRRFEAYDLEMIEQPMAKDAINEMGILQSQTSIPIVADESVQTEADVMHLADAGVAGVNIKLMKAGGLSAGLRLTRIARERGMRVMLGCMVETSLGTTAMAHLMGLAEWVDLDAPMLISNDIFDGVTYDENARVVVPDRPGIGVVQKSTR
jgi:L-alanine-DL-glutamate epimerase-like enolase superfamily enzyme